MRFLFLLFLILIPIQSIYAVDKHYVYPNPNEGRYLVYINIINYQLNARVILIEDTYYGRTNLYLVNPLQEENPNPEVIIFKYYPLPLSFVQKLFPELNFTYENYGFNPRE